MSRQRCRAAVARCSREGLLARFLLAAFLVLAMLVGAACLARSASLPAGVGRELSPSEQAEVIARNSPLASYARLSPNASFPRQAPIDKITIHHMGADLSLSELGQQFSQADRQASSNYGIDSQGNVGLYVEESDRAFTSSSAANDERSVTIEVANDVMEGEWHVSDEALAALIDLACDICRRNGISQLAYTGTPEGNLTTHKMFSARTECPGPYLESLLPEIARTVNERLREARETDVAGAAEAPAATGS